MDMDWNALPPDLAGILLAGGVGAGHLTGAARTALDLAAREPGRASFFSGLAVALLEAAWAWDPLDPRAAGQMLALAGAGTPPGTGPDPRGLRRSLADMAVRAARPSRDAERAQGLVRRGRIEQARDLLASALAHDPVNGLLLRQVLALGRVHGQAAWARVVLGRPWPGPARPVQAFVLGDLDLFLGDFEGAARHYALALDSGAFPEARPRRAECLLALGRRPQALAELRLACGERPWNVNVLLRLADLVLGADLDTAPLPGRTAVCLYTWNKAPDLDAALTALFAGDLGEARVAVLDNGSTDETPRVLDRWAARAAGRMIRVDLPVNVGAPAARNWLLGLPGVADTDFVAFLDDDALVPPDWLGRLGAAARRFPGASAWGCKVVDAAEPRVVQSVDLHLKAPEAPEASGTEGSAPPGPAGEACNEDRPGQVRLTDLHVQTPDFGQFGYARPCPSVTGCCHLLPTARLRAAGGFDIRFSPSQYDDVDRDLAACLAGEAAAYTGHLAVRHLKRSGEAARLSRAAAGNGLGNQHKLNHKYPRQAVGRLQALDLEAMLADLLEKRRIVDG